MKQIIELTLLLLFLIQPTTSTAYSYEGGYLYNNIYSNKDTANYENSYHKVCCEDNSSNTLFNNMNSSNLNEPEAIILKNPFYPDPNGQEISFGKKSDKFRTILNELSGEIVFEEGGYKTSASDDMGNIFDIYNQLYISYSGNEEVDFTICVNDSDLLNSEDLSQFVVWDDSNHRFIVYLPGFIGYFSDWNEVYLYFSVTIHAAGYEDLTKDYSTFFAYVPDTEGLSIDDYCADYSYRIEVRHGYGRYYCNLDYSINCIHVYPENVWEPDIYAIERLDHDYYLTVIAGQKHLHGSVYGYIEKTILIPARECDISITQYENIKPGYIYSIIENGSCYYTDKELSECFAIIESDNLWYLGASVTIDGESLGSSELSSGNLVAINLLPYGNIFGGEYHIDITVTDGYFSFSTDTVMEIHPIETRLTPDSLIIDISPDINNSTLLINGDDVGLLSDGHHYMLERLDHEYSIIAQIGFRTTTLWGEDYSGWSEETIIVVPPKHSFDIDDDGFVNIFDVTTLIDFLLTSNASAINLTNADCNEDGTVSISDVTTLIDFILHK